MRNGIYNFAVAYSKLEKNNEAIEYFRKAVQFQTGSMSTWYNLAICLSKTNKISEAAEAYRKVTELEPEYPEAHYNLAVSYQMLGKLDDAVAIFQKGTGNQADLYRGQIPPRPCVSPAGQTRRGGETFAFGHRAGAGIRAGQLRAWNGLLQLGQYENAKLYFRIAENQGIPTPDDIRQNLYSK